MMNKPNDEVLRFENCEQLKRLMEDPNFDQKLSLPPNKDIIHRIVANTCGANCTEIHEIKQILEDIISKHRNLLNFLAYNEKETPLHQPNVHLELIKFLVNQGARVDRVTKTRELTFVHVAAQHLNPDEFHELVKFLLEMELGGLMEARDSFGATPIHTAISSLEVKDETISLLRDSGDLQFDINVVDKEGNNILSYAIMGGRDEAYINFLRRLGAVPTTNSLGYSVLHHAASFGNLDAVKLFGSKGNVNLEASGGMTPLHLALSRGRENIHDVVVILLKKWMEFVLFQDEEGQTPLWLAKNGPLKKKVEPRTVELLRKTVAEIQSLLMQDGLGRGCDSGKGSSIGDSEEPGECETVNVSRASSVNEVPEIELPDPHISANDFRDDAIHKIVTNSIQCSDEEVELKTKEIAKILQTSPELLNMRVGDDERTPLLCQKVSVKLLKFLITLGADVAVKTKGEKETILHATAQYLCPETYNELVLLIQEKSRPVLKALDSRGRQALHSAAYHMDIKKETIRAFQESGVDITGMDESGWNMLSYAAAGGRTLEFFRMLTSSFGLKPVKDNIGGTLIHAAAKFCTLEAMKYLIELTPEHVNALDDDLLSPLHHASGIVEVTEEHLKIVHALLHDFGVKQHLNEEPMRNLIHCVVEDSIGCTPDQIKIKKQIIEKLLECDRTLIEAKVTDNKATPLAVPLVHVDLMKYLIQNGCNPLEKLGTAHDQYSFLHLIRELSPEQYHDLIEFLIHNGYRDVLSIRDATLGTTPLHEAVRFIELKEDTVDAFKWRGFGCRILDDDGWNVVFHAVEGGRSLDFLKMLMDKGHMGKDDIGMIPNGRLTSAVHLSASKGHVEALKFFLEMNPGLANCKDQFGNFPLQLAMKSATGDMKRLEIVKLLLNVYKVKVWLRAGAVLNLMRLCLENAHGKSGKEIEERFMIMESLLN